MVVRTEACVVQHNFKSNLSEQTRTRFVFYPAQLLATRFLSVPSVASTLF